MSWSSNPFAMTPKELQQRAKNIPSQKYDFREFLNPNMEFIQT